jgi:hypothetical protein
LAKVAAGLTNQDGDMAVAHLAGDGVIGVVDQTNRPDGGRGQDRLSVGFIVTLDIALRDRHM